MSKVWVTSDTHFNHDGILKHCAKTRPWTDVTSMNEGLITAWNERVGPKDEVWVLGDFAYPWKSVGHLTYDELSNRLNGGLHLVVGNHDTETMKDGVGGKARDHHIWLTVQDYIEFKFGKSRFVFSHYPFETWRNAHHGWYHLHGHCHGTLKRVIPHRMDVGVDTHPECAPYALEDVRDLLAAQQNYTPTDHHGD